jgi:tRNA dimethylallyltransferase
VRRIRDRLGPQASQAVGYKELVRYLDGDIERSEAVRLIKRNTRRLAKSQETWFRKFPGVQWINVSEHGGDPSAVAEVAEEYVLPE